MAQAILIRTDADNSTGYGHLARCLTLAAELRRRDIRSVFVMNRADAPALELIRQHGHPVRITSVGGELMAEARELSRSRIAAQAMLLDFSHQHVLQQAARVPEYVAALRSAFGTVAMIDGLGRDAVAGRVGRLEVDFLFVPYIGANGEAPPAGVASRLSGPEFFVFAPSFRPFSGIKRRIRRHAHRVLITFGGTDPRRITLKALAAIGAIRSRRLEVRVVAGPGFEETLIRRVRAAASASDHAIDVLSAPATLAGHMAWCDLAVSGSGLTKYELALTGTPSIQISLDEMHARVNKPFLKEGSAIHLGVHNRITASRLAKAIDTVLDDAAARRRMAQRGQALCDGLGAERIVSMLLAKTGSRARREPARDSHSATVRMTNAT